MCSRKLSLATLIVLLLSGYTLAGSQMPMEDSWDRTLGILLFVDGRESPSSLRAHSPNYSFVWDADSTAPDFRATNPSSNLGTYINAFLDDQDGRPDRLGPGGDTPESRARTLQWWLYEADGVGHPDWILYQCDRVTPAYAISWPPDTFPNMPLDITNPAVIDWKLKNLDAAPPDITALSADGFYIGNFNRACGVWRDGEWVQLFTGDDGYDALFEAAAIAWAGEVRRRLVAQPYPKGLVVNCPPVTVYEEDQLAALLANVDGILDEYGFTDFDSSESLWPLKIRRIIDVQNQGVAYYGVNYIDKFPPTEQQLNWILGSYLMAKEHSEYLVITEQITDNDMFPHPTWPHLPEYDVDLGHPCGEMTTAQGVYVREFSRGLALVNPSASASYSFALPAVAFTDLYGTLVETDVLLEPASGKVLVSAVPLCF